jgi:hypothetical protein
MIRDCAEPEKLESRVSHRQMAEGNWFGFCDREHWSGPGSSPANLKSVVPNSEFSF